MKINKILLVYAAYALPEQIYRGDKKRIFWEPLGISYLKGYLMREGYEVDLLYPVIENMQKEDVEEFLLKNAKIYDLVAFSAATFNVEIISELVEIIKKSEYRNPILLGGLGPSCAWESFLDSGVDLITIGEGEKTLLKIIRHLEQGYSLHDIKGVAYVNEQGEKVRNGYVELIESLDENAFPARDISLRIARKIGKEHFHVQIQSSRGCYGNCSFCSMARLLNNQGGLRYRGRSPQNVADEIEYLNKEYGFVNIDFMDENFFPSNPQLALEKAREFANEIKRRNLRVKFFIQFQMQIVSKELLDLLYNIGTKCIYVGVDSFDDEMLQVYNKPYDIDAVYDFLNIVKESPYGFEVDAEYRVKIGYINFSPLSTIKRLRAAGDIFKKNIITYKKLFTILRIDDEQSTVYKNLLERYPEYTGDKYFRDKKVKIFYVNLVKYYNAISETRAELRNLESILDNDKINNEASYKCKNFRRWMDEEFISCYMDLLDLIEEKDDLECASEYTVAKIQLFYRKWNETKIDMHKYIRQYVKFDFVLSQNMHVKEYD